MSCLSEGRRFGAAALDGIAAMIAERTDCAAPGCVVAVVHEGEVVWQVARGMADLERGVPLKVHSVFDIASTGKQFTAFVIALLEYDGILSLDDPVRRYLPELRASADAVRLRHLVYHTSGLRDYTVLMQEAGMHHRNHYPEESLLDLIVRHETVDFFAGKAHRYSNTGYFLLGIVAERATGKSIRRLIRERILEPLNMRATDFSDDPRRIVPNRALGYSPREGGGYLTDVAACGGFGDGAVITTAGDLALWDRNFYDNRLGGGAGLVRRVLAPGMLDDGTPLDYAFGLRLGMHGGLRTVRHEGSWAGYRAELLRVPERKLSVICLANARDIDAEDLARRAADICLQGHAGDRPGRR